MCVSILIFKVFQFFDDKATKDTFQCEGKRVKRKKSCSRRKKRTHSARSSQDDPTQGQGDNEVESELRTKRIQKIKKEIQNGTYRVDARKVAKKMLFELWTDLGRIKKS